MPLPNLDGMWAHPVMKLGEEFCVHDRRPACDVVRACHEVVEVCGLPGLSGVRINGSPTLAGCSVLLAKHLLLYTGAALLGRRPPVLLWHVLLTCFQICTLWLPPRVQNGEGPALLLSLCGLLVLVAVLLCGLLGKVSTNGLLRLQCC